MSGSTSAPHTGAHTPARMPCPAVTYREPRFQFAPVRCRGHRDRPSPPGPGPVGLVEPGCTSFTHPRTRPPSRVFSDLDRRLRAAARAVHRGARQRANHPCTPATHRPQGPIAPRRRAAVGRGEGGREFDPVTGTACDRQDRRQRRDVIERMTATSAGRIGDSAHSARRVQPGQRGAPAPGRATQFRTRTRARESGHGRRLASATAAVTDPASIAATVTSRAASAIASGADAAT